MIRTAPELARELGVNPKRLRAFLRRTATDHTHGTRWVIDDSLAAVARSHFGRSDAAVNHRERSR